MRRLPVALGLQLILWHDVAAARPMRWTHAMSDGEATVDIAAQIQATLKQAHENYSDD
jgi:hypothetical protein